MTTWDKIYSTKKLLSSVAFLSSETLVKEEAKGENSQTWTIPSEKFFPLFQSFLDKSNFPVKHALDIGCGIGKYLKLLQENGFLTDGIDSSTVAVEMTKELLQDNSLVQTAKCLIL